MSDVQHIRGVIPGNALQIHRKIMNPGKPEPVIEVNFQVVSWTKVILVEKSVKAHLSRNEPPPDDGWISNQGNKDPFVVDFRINLFAYETQKLNGNPDYIIKLKTHSNSYEVEIGSFISDDSLEGMERGIQKMELMSSSPPSPPLPPPPSPPPPPPPPPFVTGPVPGDANYSSDTSYTTYADACITVNGREELIIDGFLDAILGDYRMLKVWDEHARRMANNTLQLRLSYEYINKFTVPEIFDGNNNPVNFNVVDFNFRDGIFSVEGDDGRQDYFVTYTFNFFPERVLRMFVEQTVLEMNFVGAGAGGGYITHYHNLNEMPQTWDGLIALGAAAKSWKRLATQSSLWRNFLIFEGDRGEGVMAPGGAAAQQAANDAATYYQTMFDSYAAATKFDKFVIGPTEYWVLFSNTGFGKFGPLGPGNQIIQNSKFRGLTVNRSYVY